MGDVTDLATRRRGYLSMAAWRWEWEGPVHLAEFDAWVEVDGSLVLRLAHDAVR